MTIKPKLKGLLKISGIAVLAIAVAAYLIYSVYFMPKENPVEVCEKIEMETEDDNKINFVDLPKVEGILKSANLYPIGKFMKEIDTRSIEKALTDYTFIEKAECYKMQDGTIGITIRQCTPVIYVMPDDAEGYFIDEQNKVIPNARYNANIIVASGKITKKYALKYLYKFGMFLEEDEFWNDQIEQIYVTNNSDNKPEVELIPRVGDHVIKLGSINDFETKLKRLRIFYDKALSTIGWEKYSCINLEYGNQIICTKKTN